MHKIVSGLILIVVAGVTYLSASMLQTAFYPSQKHVTPLRDVLFSVSRETGGGMFFSLIVPVLSIGMAFYPKILDTDCRLKLLQQISVLIFAASTLKLTEYPSPKLDPWIKNRSIQGSIISIPFAIVALTFMHLYMYRTREAKSNVAIGPILLLLLAIYAISIILTRENYTADLIVTSILVVSVAAVFEKYSFPQLRILS